jgi:MerR family transcriptional regulator, light-induced transcriptional regulator
MIRGRVGHRVHVPRRPSLRRRGGEQTLSIGDLARATGVSTATLRVWEERHAFPLPRRLDSGHRRYSRDDIEAVLEVRRRREAGVRLDAAIQQVVASTHEPLRPAVYARISAAHPAEPRQRLRKSTLIALSHAIEDEAVATAQHAHLFASFQTTDHYAAARPRWEQIARLVASAHVFADFDGAGPGIEGEPPGPVRVGLPDDAPMLREWAVVCDAPDLPVALLAWEPPGQQVVCERDRVLDTIWTIEPRVVRDAARWSAEAAAAAGSRRAGELLAGALAGPASSGAPTPLAVGRLVLRILAELDADRRSSP